MAYVYLSTTLQADGAEEDLDAQADAIMENLLDLEGGVDGLCDTAVSLDTGTRVLAIEMGMHAPAGMSRSEAEMVFKSAIRSAIHAAGGETPARTWEPAGGHHASSKTTIEYA